MLAQVGMVQKRRFFGDPKQQGQRRLQRVRQIADRGTGLLQAPGDQFQQMIDLVHQRPDFVRHVQFDTLTPTGADLFQFAADQRQRPQRAPDIPAQHADRSHQNRQRQRKVGGAYPGDIVIDRRQILGDMNVDSMAQAHRAQAQHQ
ncbi:hypothetical protein [Methylomonas sp. CM2]|uniref:hypothetical protein n=1 Tax=Methylomonas sp. CM2 TaxID=3417647 RepID=UPI003CE68E26